MKKLKVTQIKSGIDRPERQKKTLQALGIKKMNNPIIVDATPQIVGMINKLQHLLTVEEV
ncbi:MAG: 50S ribosomal protein L30 [Bacteroidota bacterium]|nr:50S ribosomal protein L30 [Bacteroidota bacterium]